ncbi:MAG TPA: manganese efflux pump MntP family protein [Polyangiaceae bacterium]
MTFLAILTLAFGLAVDATAVSATRGLAVPRVELRHVAVVASFFGGFQALMPLLGYLAGSQAGPAVADWDHWIAFGLLAAIGSKMLWEARKTAEPASVPKNPFGVSVMFPLAIATSIDAFAVGIALPMLNAPLALSMLTIGLVTAALSALGLYAGRRFGALVGKHLEVVGGLTLIALGVKILSEHLNAG